MSDDHDYGAPLVAQTFDAVRNAALYARDNGAPTAAERRVLQAILDALAETGTQPDFWRIKLSWPITYRNVRQAPSNGALIVGRVSNNELIEVVAYADSLIGTWGERRVGGWVWLGGAEQS